jgi:hypothetical protein
MSHDLNPHQLSNLADCASPDSGESPGALFLTHVQDSVNDRAGYADDGYDLHDTAHEIADSNVPVYTHEMWTVFTDLCAWQEDVAGEFGPIEDMEEGAQTALYMIAFRLATALLEELDTDGEEE